ncbi:YaaC family protein, partial [Deinococcus cellulosilyticus]
MLKAFIDGEPLNTLRIISERPIEDIFSHLSQYESTKLALKLIQRKDKCNTLTPELAEAKAIGVAYCLRNAREYLRQTEVSWTTRLLNGYYGMMALTGALMIADPDNTHTLQDFEGFTKKGHGLSNIDSEAPFPEGQLIYLTKKGLFLEFATHLGLKLDAFKVKDRPESTQDLHLI